MIKLIPEYGVKAKVFHNYTGADAMNEYHGEPFEILKKLHIGPPRKKMDVFLIRFNDGKEYMAWPEEVFRVGIEHTHRCTKL